MRIGASLAFLIGLLLLGGEPDTAQAAGGVRRSFARVALPGAAPVRLFVEERGAGRPVVLLHGLGASTYTWRHVAPTLAVHHRVISIDLKGFGRSEKPLDERYSVFDQARLVSAFLEQRGLFDVAIVGHSLGGTVALALAGGASRTAPERIGRLIVIDSPVYPGSIPAEASTLVETGVGDVTLAVTPPEIFVLLALKASFHDIGKIEHDAVFAYAQALYQPGGRHAVLASGRALVSPDFGRLARRLSGIHQPTLIVWGREDRVVPLETGKRLARSLPNAKLRTLGACGHVPPEETPHALLALIEPFLAQ